MENKKKSSLEDAMHASIVGAKEDIIHVSEYEGGYDLRAHGGFDGLRQKMDEESEQGK